MCSSIPWKRTCPAYAFPHPVGVDAADTLWKHTCFEAFVAPADGPGYHEFNFSPSHDYGPSTGSVPTGEGMAPAEVGRAPEISASVRRGEGWA